MKPERIRVGLYKLAGVTHAGRDFPGGPVCGGQIFAERIEDRTTEYRWECYCERCGGCDPNGWPTLADCVSEAPGYWGTVEASR